MDTHVQRMHRILFVCYGNMCRSPTAHFVFQHMVDERGLSDLFHIDSAGEGYNIDGMSMSHGTIDELVAHKIPFNDNRLSRQFEPYDYELFDHIIAMDNENVESLREQTHDDPDRKISLLLSFTGEGREIDDPYYTGKYAKAFDEIHRGCEALLEKLLSED